MDSQIKRLESNLLAKCLELTQKNEFGTLNDVVDILGKITNMATVQDIPTTPAATIDIESAFAQLRYPPEDDEFFSAQWRTISEVAKWNDVSQATVRRWCENGNVVSELDPTKTRRTWKVCPKSIAFMINQSQDPRISPGDIVPDKGCD